MAGAQASAATLLVLVLGLRSLATQAWGLPARKDMPSHSPAAEPESYRTAATTNSPLLADQAEEEEEEGGLDCWQAEEEELAQAGVVPLTEFGRNASTIAIVGMGGGLVCSRTHDWRANLPRYLGHYSGATVIVHYRNGRCRYCWTPDRPKHQRFASCHEQLTAGVDLMVMVGSGKIMAARPERCGQDPLCTARFIALRHTLQLPWVQSATRIVHFPIRTLPPLTENQVFGFDAVIDDNSFPKPVSNCAAATLQACSGVEKGRELAYVARMTAGKGQLRFLETVEPKLLEGTTVNLFGRADSRAYVQQLKSTAAKRGIAIAVGKLSKNALFKRLCRAAGLVMMSDDSNPRSVYEALMAGLPVFVTDEAQVSSTLYGQPWYIRTSLRKDSDRINRDFQKFLEVVAQGSWTQHIQAWAATELSNKVVYQRLCQRIGLCRTEGFEEQPPRNTSVTRWSPGLPRPMYRCVCL
mmetsp:Transcript_29349/g.82772  ORF Transcript_29349/g.82772 Transcript_29349/m.82772 type:complete len:468 (+) Transcript_29349:335-1738(+)